jgi:hypothetical protein
MAPRWTTSSAATWSWPGCTTDCATPHPGGDGWCWSAVTRASARRAWPRRWRGGRRPWPCPSPGGAEWRRRERPPLALGPGGPRHGRTARPAGDPRRRRRARRGGRSWRSAVRACWWSSGGTGGGRGRLDHVAPDRRRTALPRHLRNRSSARRSTPSLEFVFQTATTRGADAPGRYQRPDQARSSCGPVNPGAADTAGRVARGGFRPRSRILGAHSA